MTTVWRVRIDEETLAQANQVTEKIGTSTQEAVRIFVAKIAATGRIPLELDPNYDDLVLDKTRRNKLLASLDDSEGW
jgi:addiction module RelB/DinJ family antitoxin